MNKIYIKQSIFRKIKQNKMPRANYNKVPERVSVHIHYLAQDAHMSLKEIQKKYPHIPKQTIHRHMNKPIEAPIDARHNNPGRKPTLSERSGRKLNSSLLKLREEVGDVHSTDVQKDAGMDGVSNRTVRRTLKKPPYNYKYTQCRKKGQLVKPDLAKRVAWAKAKDKLPARHWMHGISFYIDGSGWAHKTQSKHKNSPHAHMEA